MTTPIRITMHLGGEGSVTIDGHDLANHIAAGLTIEHRPHLPPVIHARLVPRPGQPLEVTADADVRLEVPDDFAVLLTAAGWVAPLTCWYCGETDGTDDCCRHSQAAT